jgi:hypothetical protein
MRTSLASTSCTPGHVEVEHLHVDAVLALERLEHLEAAPPAGPAHGRRGVGQPLQLGEHR